MWAISPCWDLHRGVALPTIAISFFTLSLIGAGSLRLLLTTDLATFLSAKSLNSPGNNHYRVFLPRADVTLYSIGLRLVIADITTGPVAPRFTRVAGTCSIQ